MKETRNSEVLASFVKFCEQNPDLRFWQALRTWSGFAFIIARDLVEGSKRVTVQDKDTFYFEEKDK